MNNYCQMVLNGGNEMLKKIFNKFKNMFKELSGEDWQHTYVDSNMNHGQGPLKEDK